LLAIFLLSYSATFTTVIAQTRISPFKVREVLPACKTYLLDTKNKNDILIHIEGVCVGAVSSVLRLGSAMSPQYRFCPSPNISISEFLPQLIKFIDQNSSTMDLDIRDVANYFGRLKYPCN